MGRAGLAAPGIERHDRLSAALPGACLLRRYGPAASGSGAGRYNLAGSAIFVVSVICRMIDPLVCGSFPLGTHFLWHIFNGLMLGVLLAAAARFGAPKTRAVGQ